MACHFYCSLIVSHASPLRFSNAIVLLELCISVVRSLDNLGNTKRINFFVIFGKLVILSEHLNLVKIMHVLQRWNRALGGTDGDTNDILIDNLETTNRIRFPFRRHKAYQLLHEHDNIASIHKWVRRMTDLSRGAIARANYYYYYHWAAWQWC